MALQFDINTARGGGLGFEHRFSGRTMAARGGVTGVREAIDYLARVEHATADDIEFALVKVGLDILRESLGLCPIDTGALRASGNLSVAGRGFSTVVTISYTAMYAIFVHENLEAYHKPPTSAKYLEIPLRKFIPMLKTLVRQQLRYG